MSAAWLAVKFSARCRCLRSSFLTSRRCAQINYNVTNWSPTLQLRSYPLHHENTARNSFSSSPSSSFTKTEYIHPLSQIVLEHLQNHHSEWVQNKGLDQGLELKKDGTFILRFPQAANTDDDSLNSSRGSIWTTYEAEESKHYLCIRNGNLVGRYMLQDNKKPAWHTDKRSTPERVQDAVDEMILKMEG